MADEDGADTLRPHPDYEPIRLIARGRCNKVFEAFETTLRRRVAIKQLDAGVNPQQASLFWREAQFLAASGHHNVVTVLGSDERRGWIITELMAGNVESKIAQGPMDPDLVRSVLRQALEGLAHFHRQSRIHGEIKPANLLVDDQGYIKLNASPGFLASDEFRVPLGCQRHVAPELLNPKAFGGVGPAVDFYCLGFTMLELLIGPGIENLFKGVAGEGKERDLAWLRWHHSHVETLPSLRQLVPDAPEDLVVVVDRLVSKRVSQRFACAEEALALMENTPLLRVPLDGEPTGNGRRRGPGAVIKGKPPTHREYAEQQEQSKDLWHQLCNSPQGAYLRSLWQQPAIRYAICGVGLLLFVLFLSAAIRPQPPRPPVKIAKGASSTGKKGNSPKPANTSGKVEPCRVAIVYPDSAASVSLEKLGENRVKSFRSNEDPSRWLLDEGRYWVAISIGNHEVLTDNVTVTKGVPASNQGTVGNDGHDGFRITYRKREENKVVIVPAPTPPPSGDSGKKHAVSDDPPESSKELSPPLRIVATTWKLPRALSPDQRKTYFQQVYAILDDAWMEEDYSLGTSTAQVAFEKAKSIHDDSRLHFAYSLFWWHRNRSDIAKDELMTAKKLEWDCWQEERARGTLPDDVPFPAPWRQLARYYLHHGDYDRAIAACDNLMRYCKKTQSTIQSADTVARTPYDSLVFGILAENVQFARNGIQFIKDNCARGSRMAPREVDRIADHEAANLSESPTCSSYAALFGEIRNHDRKKGGAASPAETTTPLAGDVYLNLALERNLMLDAACREMECLRKTDSGSVAYAGGSASPSLSLSRN
jgi:serine/threonine protein kinase